MGTTQKIESFIAGHWQNRYQYKSFEPTHINTSWVWEEPKINTMLERATKALGELNAFSLIVPDIDLFIQMHITKEAQTSSKIEGTQTQLDEALMPEEQIQPEKRDDWREVQNYIKAMNQAVNSLKELPLSNRLLKETHHTLISGARGKHKLPGEFRSSQNWIGGSGLMDAAFIPPHHEGVPELMSDLEQFWHNDEIFVPHLIRIAISHYQFETIHPFLDGNGRVGRLLIPLYLISHGVLEKPSFYISDFFERNRASYYDALMASHHKYSGGVVGIVAGSRQYPGAAVLTCGGALRATPSMVRYAGPCAAQVLQHFPEIVLAELRDNPRVDCWVVGPGMGLDPGPLAAVIGSPQPLVIDADGLTVLAKDLALLDERCGSTLLTPHEGEAARLLSALGTTPDLATDRLGAVRALAQGLGCSVLLKGRKTLIAYPSGAITSIDAGHSWLATPGTGDVLAGVLGAVAAQEGGFGAAAWCVGVHAYAGWLAAASPEGCGPILASDVIAHLPAAVAAFSYPHTAIPTPESG